MDFEERNYFESMKKYHTRKIGKIISSNTLEEIKYNSLKIQDIAKYALAQEISPNNAKKEILSLVSLIKAIKREGKIE
jgi:hypothetical protein